MFTTWLALGGTQSPPTITEILTWPAALRHDIMYLLREYGEAQTAVRRRKGKAKRGARK